MEKEIRWGIAGLGNIAHKFADDLKLVPGSILKAVGSRQLDRATAFGKKHDATHCFGSYLELFECEEVDVVYIATPHTSHAELSIAAMNHGKHVLCEKPLSTNREKAIEMIEAAVVNNVFLMEALWSRFNPAIVKILEHIEQGDIGTVNYIHADFAFYALERSEEGRLLNPQLAGGSILDIGIYPIFLAYLILGMPEKILAASNFYKTGVEIQTSMIFSYPNAQAILYSGLNSKSEMKAEIAGTKGSLFLDPRWHEAQGYSTEIDAQIDHFDHPTSGNGYVYEIEEVNTCIRSSKLQSELWSHQNSIDLLQIMDEVRAQGQVIFPFER
ncbi:MAG: Gfo/Idh/MocA family protein [Flavobacteriaceae bacterium]